MNLAKHRTWDQELVRRIRGWDRARCARASSAFVLAILVAGLVVGGLPGTAHAHFDTPGITGAQLDAPDSAINPFTPNLTPIKGKKFVANDRAFIFECPAGAIDLRNQCITIGAAATDAVGAFSAQVNVVSIFASPSGTEVNCKGWRGATTQCAVVAATYNSALQTTSIADHYICFEGGPCSFEREGPTTTTTLPLGATWQAAPALNTARAGLAAATGNDGSVYALGGSTATGQVLRSVEVLAPCATKWTQLPPMPTPRSGLAAAAGLDGLIYAIGGQNDTGFLDTVEVYNPGTNSWGTASPLLHPRAGHAAVAGADGRIYAIGMSEDLPLNDPWEGTVEVYDPATNRWLLTTPTPVGPRRFGAARGPDGRIHIFGGAVNAGLNSLVPLAAEAYTPGPAGAPGTWLPTAAPEIWSTEVAGATGADGRIYAIGGHAGGAAGSQSRVEAYDSARDAWTYVRPMSTTRFSHAAATSTDGRIYAIGGRAGVFDLVTSSVEALQVGPNPCPPPAPKLAPADFDGNSSTDYSVFRPETGTWFVKDGLTTGWGIQGDIPVPADYDYDGSTDIAVFRPSNGVWYIRNSGGGDTVLGYGIDGDIPVPADYDGDHKADIAVFRPSNGVWYIHYSGGGDAAFGWGATGDVAVPADYDGDDKADAAVFRGGVWYIRPASGATDITVSYGTAGDIPVVADYDADETADVGVFRPSNGAWYLRHSSDNTQEAFAFGADGDVPVLGDYNGDAITDPAVFRPSNGTWYVDTGEDAAWGIATDVPLPLPAAVRMAFFSGTQ